MVKHDPTQVSTDELTQLRLRARGIALPPRRHVHSGMSGSYLSQVRGRGMEFEEVRQYQAGDDIRLMDWRVTARTGKPHTKVFREERERPVMFVVDFSPTMYFGTRRTFKSCQAAQVAALLGWAAVGHGDRVGAILHHPPGLVEVKPAAGTRGIFRLIGALKAAANHAPTDTQTARSEAPYQHARRLCRPGAMVFVISDFWHFSAAIERELSQLTQRHDLYCIMISDRMEVDGLPAGSYPVASERGEFARLNVGNPRQQAALERALASRFQRVRDFCRTHAANFLHVCTDEAPHQALEAQMGRRPGGRR